MNPNSCKLLKNGGTLEDILNKQHRANSEIYKCTQPLILEVENTVSHCRLINTDYNRPCCNMKNTPKYIRKSDDERITDVKLCRPYVSTAAVTERQVHVLSSETIKLVVMFADQAELSLQLTTVEYQQSSVETRVSVQLDCSQRPSLVH